MIIAIVNFQLGVNHEVDAIRKRFEESVPRFRNLPGLLRKNYLYDPASGVGGGVYLWQTRAQAEAYYSPAWRERMHTTMGNTPAVRYFEMPVEVDNSSN